MVTATRTQGSTASAGTDTSRGESTGISAELLTQSIYLGMTLTHTSARWLRWPSVEVEVGVRVRKLLRLGLGLGSEGLGGVLTRKPLFSGSEVGYELGVAWASGVPSSRSLTKGGIAPAWKG